MRIVVRNTAILIRDYTKGECESLEHYFTTFDPVTHSFNVLGMYYDEEERTLYLPAGIDLWWVEKKLGIHGFDREVNHPFKKIEKQMKCSEQPRDEVQMESIRFLTASGEYTENQYATQLSLQANTGKGKTYCAIISMMLLGVKTVIITGSSSLLTQWEGEFAHFTNLGKGDLLRINGSDMMIHILSGKSKAANEASVYLVTHQTLGSFATQYGWLKLNDLFAALGVGLKIFDEYHTQFKSMLMIDFFTNVWKTFYLSATAARSSFEENKIFQSSYNKMPKLDLFNPEIDPHTAYVAIKFNSKPTPLDLQKLKNAYGIDLNRYCTYLTRNSEFYKIMHVVMQMVINNGGINLMYLHTNDAILRVYKWISMTYPQFLGEIGIFTSLVPKEQKVLEKKKKLILTTIKSGGLGEHIEHLKCTFVIADPFRSEVLARQSLGRTRDRDTVYVELVDLGFRHITKFYRAKLPVFNKYATSVSDVLVDQYELQRRYENIIRQRIPWKECPIELYDERFEFPDDMKPKEDPDPNCPIEFFNDDDLSNWLPLY